MPRQTVIADPAFARRLKELREERGLSLRRLGRQVHCSHGYLWDLESGIKRPSVSVAVLLDGALGADGQLSALVHETSADVGHRPDDTGAEASTGLSYASNWQRGVDAAVRLWRSDIRRQDGLRNAGFSAPAFLPPAMRWLVSSFDERPAGRGERLVGRPDVETVRQMTATYRALDNRFGGGHVRESLIRFLNQDVAEVISGSYDVTTGRHLLSAVAEATRLAGWTSYDAGMHGLAQRYLIQALRLAAGAGDRALGAEILAAMSHQAAYQQAPVEAVDLALAASRAAGDAGVAAIQAESAVLEAHGHAIGGDERASARALSRAEVIFDKADRAGEPQWIGYFDESYLAAKFGHCFTALGRGDIALRFAARSLEMDGRQFARGRQFNLVLLAVAHIQTGNPEEAARLGIDAIDATEGLRSARARDYLVELANRLSKHVGLPAVRDFTERAALPRP
ncbi:helix-turn-helix domain-containing protein [Actinoplanes sp. CA-030573]|uniref:helix-turn-helix domain-containing protein n=1 Tax=Actinoplanes sp. CA-030573 TaxID=3239898 RepID=UPI003D90A1E4